MGCTTCRAFDKWLFIAAGVGGGEVIRASGGVEFPTALRQIPSVKACGDGCRVLHTVAD